MGPTGPVVSSLHYLLYSTIFLSCIDPVWLKVCHLSSQGAPGKDGDVGAPGPAGPAVSKTHVHINTWLSCSIPYAPDGLSLQDTSNYTFLLALTLPLLLIFRVPLAREESKELLELLDSRVFQDPRVLLVRLESPESRYWLRLIDILWSNGYFLVN